MYQYPYCTSTSGYSSNSCCCCPYNYSPRLILGPGDTEEVGIVPIVTPQILSPYPYQMPYPYDFGLYPYYTPISYGPMYPISPYHQNHHDHHQEFDYDYDYDHDYEYDYDYEYDRENITSYSDSNWRTGEIVPKTGFTTEETMRIGRILGIDFHKEKFDVAQFRIGLDVELEHGRRSPNTNVTNDDPILTGKIALAHLREFPDYYTRLSKFEEEAKAYWSESPR